MIVSIVILSLSQAFVIIVIVWLCYSVIEARSETFEANAARQRAEVQLHETSREYIEYRRTYGHRNRCTDCNCSCHSVAGDSPSQGQEEVRDGRSEG